MRRSWIRSWRSNCRDETLTLANRLLARTQRTLPGAELARGALENEQAEFDNQSGLLGDIDEFVRRHPAQLRMVPARQRLEAGDRAILEPDDRLIENRDFLALERPPQIGLDRQPVGLARPHRGLEHLDTIAAVALGVIHREFGVLEPSSARCGSESPSAIPIEPVRKISRSLKVIGARSVWRTVSASEVMRADSRSDKTMRPN